MSFIRPQLITLRYGTQTEFKEHIAFELQETEMGNWKERLAFRYATGTNIFSPEECKVYQARSKEFYIKRCEVLYPLFRHRTDFETLFLLARLIQSTDNFPLPVQRNALAVRKICDGEKIPMAWEDFHRLKKFKSPLIRKAMDFIHDAIEGFLYH